jgi:MFS transporter, putative metabolite:H+ symporter
LSIASRIERIPDNRYYKKLLVLGGLGYTFEAMDGAVIAFVLAAIIKPWHLSAAKTGILGSALLVGFFIGAFLSGYIGDLIGRKKVIIWTLVIYSVASLISAFAANWEQFFWLRVIAGIGAGGETAIIAPYLTEMIASKYRGKYVGALSGFFSFGYVGAAILSYLVIPTSPIGWRITVIITAIPVFLVIWWRKALPESPRWLEAKGNLREADRVMVTIEKEVEKRIGTLLTDVAEDEIGYEAADGVAAITPKIEAKSKPFVQLFQQRFLKSTIMLWIIWFSIVFAYYGFFTWIPSLLVKQGLHIAKSFEFSIIIYLAQIPGYFSAAYLNDRIGRKKVVISYLVASAIAAFFMSQSHTPTAIVTWGFFMSMFMNGSFAGLYVYTPEQYPTQIRATGTGSASSFGRIGGLLAPIAIGYLLPVYGFSGVFILSTVVLLIGALSILILGNETNGKYLEQIAYSNGALGTKSI